jgi:hypothetical protein
MTTILKLLAVALLSIGGLIAWGVSAHHEHPAQRSSTDPNPGTIPP